MIGAVRWGPLGEGSSVELTRPTITLRRLPAAFDGFRIALLCDLHYGWFVQPSYVTRIIQHLRQAQPNIAVLGGDMVEHTRVRAAALAERVAPLAQAIPTYGVLGNHEYHGRVKEFLRRFRAAGVEVLVNEHCLIGPDGRPASGFGPAIALLGLDDYGRGSPDFQAAADGLQPGTFTILLGHSPDLADDLGPRAGVDLMLAGHTHGGQIRLLGWAPITFTRNRSYLSGLTAGPAFPLYVSRGLGMTGLPLRIGADAELPVLTLRSNPQ
jgi:predicted MPP superfamily phosphohydrolase